MFCMLKKKKIYLPYVSKHSSNLEKQVILLIILNGEGHWWHYLAVNKNTLTGPANCKKTRHHVHLSLCVKSRKNNDGKSRKWPKISIWVVFLTISRSNISKLQNFLKNRFHSNWRSYLVLTSGQKLQKLLAIFEKNIKVSDFGLIWRPFHKYLQLKNFFQKSSSLSFLPL